MRSFISVILCVCVASVIAQDRIATLPDGSKVVLKGDGTWAPAPAATPTPVPTADRSMKGVIADRREVTYAALQALGDRLIKSEFETARQYLQRLRPLLDETRVPTAAGRRLSDTVFFFTELATYDAERQQFNLNGIRIAFTGIGPRVNLVDEYTRFGWNEPVLRELPSVKMPPDQAQAAKPNLTVAIYGYPVAIKGLPRPSIQLIPRRVVVFDSSTGEIFADDIQRGAEKVFDMAAPPILQ